MRIAKLDKGFRERNYKQFGPKTPWRQSTNSHKYEDYETALVMKSKYNGICNSCKQGFAVGDPIIFNKYTHNVYHHPKCP